MRIKIISLIISLCFLCSGCVFNGKNTDVECAPIRVGVVLSESEDGIGYEQKLGYELALQELNADGGVMGCPIELVYRDEGLGSSVETAEVAVMELAGEEIAAIIGATSSAATLRAASISSYFKIPFMVSSQTSDEIVSQNNQWVFRISASNVELANLAFDMARAQVGTDVYVAVIFEQSAYGQSSAIAAANSAMERGMRVVSYQDFDLTQSDYTDMLTAAEDAGPDLVYLISSQAEQASDLLDAMEKYDLDQKILIGYGSAFSSREFLYDYGGNLIVTTENLLLVQPWSQVLPWHGVEKFIYDFENAEFNEAGSTPVLANAEAYAALNLIGEVLGDVLKQDNGSWITDEREHDAVVNLQDAIAQELRDYHGGGHETIFGPISFDASGQNDQQGVAMQIQKGELLTVYPSEYAVEKPEIELGW